MKKFAFFLFPLVFWCISSNAQLTVTGKLVNIDGEPIPYANITIANLGAVSNQLGQFQLRATGINAPAVVKISCVGFETKQISLDPKLVESDLGIILMDRKVTELSEVIVRAKAMTVGELLSKIRANLSRNFSSRPFKRELSVMIRKFDRSAKLVQKVEIALHEYYLKGYTKNLRKSDDLVQGRVTAEKEFMTVDDDDLYWIDLFFLRRHDAYSYSYPYTFPKAYNYSFCKDVYEYDGNPATALEFEAINPDAQLVGGWPNAIRIFGKIFVNENDYAVLRIEETIVLKDYDPQENSAREPFGPAIQFKQLTNIVNFRKIGEFYYLSDSHVERVIGDARKPFGVIKTDLVATSYSDFKELCNPCNLKFSKAKNDPRFWESHTVFLD